jgi:hypothetical protein
MLRQVAEGVLIHQSEFCQSNAVVVQGRAGVLLIDHKSHEIGWRHNVDTATANSQVPASAFIVRSDWCADFAKAQSLS